MKIGFLGVIIGLVAIFLGDFVGGAFSRAVLMPFAPADAGVGFATLIGLLHTIVWVAVVWVISRVFQSLKRKRAK